MATTNHTAAEPAFHVPQLDRLNYFYGQMLGVGDFRAEQTYFREKLKLHNRCLHGYGTVCGLHVHAPPPPKPECAHEPQKPIVCLEPGMALDVEGNELIVRTGDDVCTINLWDELSLTDQQTVTKAVGTDPDAWYCEPVYVCLHFRECPLGPCVPIAPDPCGGTLPKSYGRLRDGVRVSVSLKEPPVDRRCETCCCQGPCACDSLLLARIDRFHKAKLVKPEDIHNECRRRLGTYPFTTITGVNWRHGRDYPRDTVHRLLREGIIVHFSRPVWIDPVHERGVVDVYLIESRNSRNANVIELRGHLEPIHAPADRLHYRVPHLDACPESADRVLIVVRCGFILDECCRPVDGLNVGGRVPHVGDLYMPCAHEPPPHEGGQPCAVPPWGYAPWTSGNGTGGGTFESWLYVEDTRRTHHHDR
jgi:hypothetical protein